MQIRRWILTKWIKMYNQTTYCLQESHFKFNDTGKLKVEGQEKICHANFNLNNSKSKNGSININEVTSEERKLHQAKKEGHYKLIKGPINQGNIIILNVCAAKNRGSKHI